MAGLLPADCTALAAEDEHSRLTAWSEEEEEEEQQQQQLPRGVAPAARGASRRAAARQQQRQGRLAFQACAGLLVLAGVAVGSALTTGSFRPGAVAGSTIEAVSLFARGPFGEHAGPDFTPKDMLLGSYPKFGNDPAARTGSPSMPKLPNLSPTCNACKATGGSCCGTSCCGTDSICCKESIGLCCSSGSMCCYGSLCCQPGFNCGRTRNFAGSLKYTILKQCGPGANFRRLGAVGDEQGYKAGLAKLLKNDTALGELSRS